MCQIIWDLTCRLPSWSKGLSKKKKEYLASPRVLDQTVILLRHVEKSKAKLFTSKIAYADIVIDKSGTRSELEDQVRLCVKRLDGVVGLTWVVSWLFPPLGLLSVGWTVLWRMPWHSRRSHPTQSIPHSMPTQY